MRLWQPGFLCMRRPDREDANKKNEKIVRKDFSKVSGSSPLPNLVEIQTDISNGIPDFEIVRFARCKYKRGKKKSKCSNKEF